MKKEEWESKYYNIAMDAHGKAGGGQDSHMAIDYDIILNLGINCIIEKTNKYLLTCSENQKPFYNTCKTCLKAVIKYSEKYADAAMKMSKETTDMQRKNELEKISEICQKVPAQPAESFYEAIQAVHFVTYCISLNPFRFCSQQFQLGHPDRYLLKYYLNDIKNSIITKEYAQLYSQHLC